MIWVYRALAAFLMLFCHIAVADEREEVLSNAATVEADTASKHSREEEDGDSFLQRPLLDDDTFVDEDQEEESDDSYDDQDVDDEATEESDDGF